MGSLEDLYDEDEDDFCIKETPSKAKKAKLEEIQQKLPQLKIPCLKLKLNDGILNKPSIECGNTELETNLDCHICKRTFPNRIRLLAHFQMHSDDDAKKKRKKSIDQELREDIDEITAMKIDQVDGATDIAD